MSVSRAAAMTLTAVTSTVAAAGGIWYWLSLSPPQTLRLRLPSEPSHSARRAPSAHAPVDIEGTFQAFEETAKRVAGTWPRFRGSTSDNIVTQPGTLSEEWPESGPPVLWSVALGDGYAAPAVANSRVYVLDYDEDEKRDALRCFSLATGQELWRRSYAVQIKRNHGMSRTIPAVTDRHVVTVGPKCHVLCVDAITGAFRWGLDLVADHGTDVPLWYTGQCPIIDEGEAIIAPGGESLLMGVDCESGQVAWRTPNPDAWGMSHASVIPTTLFGTRMFVYCALGGIVAVSADTESRGQVLWKTTEWKHSVVAPSPVFLPDGRMLVTAGYGVGSRMFQIHKSAETWSVETLDTWPRTHFACEQQTPIFQSGRLFTIMPNDAGPLNRQLVCMNPDGEHLWSSGKGWRFGLGPFMIAGDRILILSDDGALTMADATTDGFSPIATADILDGRE
ncbi:MAG: PQQ-binding-like beta-propeller repeat protein, partial [Verrucomicrobia bacterium]|nr:PQQ-binding-like beta-propeller repeat protein [Verrucomicrobiota bacterium]